MPPDRYNPCLVIIDAAKHYEPASAATSAVQLATIVATSAMPSDSNRHFTLLSADLLGYLLSYAALKHPDTCSLSDAYSTLCSIRDTGNAPDKLAALPLSDPDLDPALAQNRQRFIHMAEITPMEFETAVTGAIKACYPYRADGPLREIIGPSQYRFTDADDLPRYLASIFAIDPAAIPVIEWAAQQQIVRSPGASD